MGGDGTRHDVTCPTVRDRASEALRAAPFVLAALATLAVLGCGGREAPPPETPVGASDRPGTALLAEPLSYNFDSLDDRPVSSAAFRGKPTLLVFVTTGDIMGQAQVDYLVAMAKNDGAHVNYALIAVHPRKEIVLVESYASALSVKFPVALCEPAALGEDGPFGEIPAVPTLVVLDRAGRLTWKHTGLAKPEAIRDPLSRAQ